MEYQDKTLTCKECGKEFIFTAGEQEFYAEKGFENEPARCRDCRDSAAAAVRAVSSARCTRSSAQTAARKRRFRSSRRTIVRYTAATASTRDAHSNRIKKDRNRRDLSCDSLCSML